jgi:hypothetical protein
MKFDTVEECRTSPSFSPGFRPGAVPGAQDCLLPQPLGKGALQEGFAIAPTNPFATRWSRPGAIPFDFGENGTVADLVHRLRANNWVGAIVGPHGSGKSTLLSTIVPAVVAAGRRVVFIGLHNGQKRLPLSWRDINWLEAASILVIDGYEQLGRLRRWRLELQCRRRGHGLLVTSHAETGLPVLFRTAPDLATVKRLIEYRLPTHGGRIRPADIEHAWRRHTGNVREVFFELYNVFEARRRL